MMRLNPFTASFPKQQPIFVGSSNNMNIKERVRMTRKIRFGIIGCGVIGRIHAEDIRNLPHWQLGGLADVSHKRAQERAEEYHVTPYAEFQNRLAEDGLD